MLDNYNSYKVCQSALMHVPSKAVQALLYSANNRYDRTSLMYEGY
jgi:hypothetical protein